MTNKLFSIILCLVPVFVINGCSTSKPANLYLLSPTQIDNNAGICVKQVKVPEYLDRSDLVRRVGKSRITYLKNHKWAQNFRKMLSETLGDSVAYGSKKQNWDGSVTLKNFELDDKNNFNVTAICRLHGRDAVSEEIIAFSIPWKNDDYETLIDIHNQAIAKIAAKLVEMAK